MRPTTFAFASILCSLIGCSSPSAEAETTSAPAENTSLTRDDVEGQSVAYFAGGCFWGVEHFMEQIPGVYGVESGYMGGHVENPTYERVSSQTSGHYETVRVRYDASKVSYHDLAKRFFEIHDPTQANGQGPDIGPEYLSVVFYANPDEKKATQALIEQLVERGYDVVTKLEPAQTFWLAEEYHQDYYVRANKKPYCHTPVDRFGDS